MSDWREYANTVMRERGKLVMRSPRKIAIGEIVHDCVPVLGGEPEQPFRVIAETNYEDFLAQHRAIGCIGEPRTLPEDTFYIVITD